MKPKPKVFVVQHRTNGNGECRLLRGTRSEVESFLLSELSIEVAKPETCVELGGQGVKVESAAAA